MPLGAGALLPSPTEPNLLKPVEVSTALSDLLHRLGRPARVVVVLPLGTGRLSLLQPPAGTDPREFARFRLGPSLPFPADEAIFDTVPAGAGRVLAGAVRRAVVAEYEELLASCGAQVERVDLLPLAAVAARRRAGSAAALDLFLGDVAFALALHEAGEVRGFRCRWRDRGPADLDRIAETLQAAARAEGGGLVPRIVVFGEESASAVAGLQARGLAASSGSEGALLGAAA